ncbi:hypothetical protein MHYP_G00244310 [Metynnis hypsauchen]
MGKKTNFKLNTQSTRFLTPLCIRYLTANCLLLRCCAAVSHCRMCLLANSFKGFCWLQYPFQPPRAAGGPYSALNIWSSFTDVFNIPSSARLLHFSFMSTDRQNSSQAGWDHRRELQRIHMKLLSVIIVFQVVSAPLIYFEYCIQFFRRLVPISTTLNSSDWDLHETHLCHQ